MIMLIKVECLVPHKSPTALCIRLQRLFKNSSGHIPKCTDCQVPAVAWAIRSLTIIVH